MNALANFLARLWSGFRHLPWWIETPIVVLVILVLAGVCATVAEWRCLGKRAIPPPLLKRLWMALKEFPAPFALVAGIAIVVGEHALRFVGILPREKAGPWD